MLKVLSIQLHSVSVDLRDGRQKPFAYIYTQRIPRNIKQAGSQRPQIFGTNIMPNEIKFFKGTKLGFYRVQIAPLRP